MLYYIKQFTGSLCGGRVRQFVSSPTFPDRF